MPLILQQNVFEDARVGVWHITEEPDYFLDRVTLTAAESAIVEGLNPVRLREWLASRYLLKVLLHLTEPLETDSRSTGKPYLIGRDEEISLSHTADYVAAMTGSVPVGVDIQVCKEKILRLEHKFARPEESAKIDRTNPLRHLHLLWGAKEALYKIYAQKGLHFLNHLYVDLPDRLHESGCFTGKIRIGDTSIRCILDYRLLHRNVLVYGKQVV